MRSTASATPVECRPSALARAGAALARAWPLLVWLAAQAQPSAATLEACVQCHGPNGNSPVALIPSIASQPRIFIENQLVLIREGLRDIPAMKALMTGMSDEEIVALAKHFAAQPVLRQPVVVEPAKARLGAELARQALCGTCHRADFSGQQQVPRLAGQNEAYLLQAMQQFRDHPGPGRDTIMSASLYGLKDTELAALAHHLAAFRPR